MKIGIVTFHNALNAGAVLQAYALQTFLQEEGYEVEFINYTPEKHYNLKCFVAKSPKVMFNKWKDVYNELKYLKRNDFNKVLNVSKIYTSIDELNENPPIYDYYIAGSDQIWNFHSQIRPFYLLSFVPEGCKKIAYAVSMGQCNLSTKIYEEFKFYLLQFDRISIRERTGVEFIKKLICNKKEIIQTVDPTLLLSRDKYIQIADSNVSISESYMCSYILNNIDEEDMQIIYYIQKYLNKKIINLRNPSTCIRLNNVPNKIVTPYQWLSYIINSDFMICSSFHAVVFSIIFHKSFISLVPPPSKNKEGNMRINSLLESLGLTNRIVSNFNQKKIEQLINQSIDWYNVDKRIEELKQPSINFLLKSLI